MHKMRSVVRRNLSVLSFKKDQVKISVPSGQSVEEKHIPPIWMRWNCTCPDCLQASSGQKLLDPLNWPQKLNIENCWSDEDMIKFTIEGDNHEGQIPNSLISKYFRQEELRKNGVTEMTFHTNPKEWIPKISYDKIMDEGFQHQLTKMISTNGYCIVTDCPTKDNSVLDVAKCVTPPIWSFYGLTFKVVSRPNAINVAYTNVALPCHMDLIYMESAPGLQYLLCIQNDDVVVGGKSILVDAYAVAEEIREKYPEQFEVLTNTPVRFQKQHYEREYPVHLEWEQSHIVLGTKGDIVRVNWAPAFEGQANMNSCTQEYLDAYRLMLNLIDSSETKLEYRLQPGECMIFNNRRMLHGRTEIELNGGQRMLEGCYTNLDEFKSRAQVLENIYGLGQLTQKVGNSNNI